VSSGVRLSASKSTLQVTSVSAGYCLFQHSVVHQFGIVFVGVNPSIQPHLTTAIMWWHDSPSVFGTPQEHPQKY
jgi:hypothetical protein